jgi:hypothetical protein
MKRVCSWCNAEMGIVQAKDFPETAITHGICEKCLNTYFGPRQVNLMDFLDSLDARVIVVNSKAIVTSANKQARDFLHKESKEIEGFMGGDVFECAFAKLPGGCGNTIHCDGCTIRNTVMDTFQSGNSHVKTPAYLLRGTPDKNHEIQFLISTEKVKETVLLRIDKIISH